jgi:hypothetical protein
MQTQIHRGTVNVQVALISCILFICIEALQGNMTAAYAFLYQQGLNLITGLQSVLQDSATFSVQPLALEDTIAPVFFRLDTVAHITSGYPLDLSMVKVDENLGVSSLLNARNVVIKLVAECMHFERLAERHLREVGPAHVEESFRSRKRLLETKFKAWRQSFDGLDQVGKSTGSRKDRGGHVHASHDIWNYLHHRGHLALSAGDHLRSTSGSVSRDCGGRRRGPRGHR